MFRLWIALGWMTLTPVLCRADITNIRITGTTATQALISYTAPDENSCTIQVSESQTFAPLVHDVDEALFAGSSSDSRSGSLVSGRSRVVVIGKHGMMARGGTNPFLARDGRRYSRALAADTTHYYKITCGADTATGGFRTGNIPLGNSYSEPLPADGTNPGVYNWPTVSTTDRSEALVDPNTGSVIRKATLTADNNNEWINNTWPSGGMFQICSHLVKEVGGHTYNLCFLPSQAATLVSIETDTGAVYPLSRVFSPYGRFGSDQFGSASGLSFSASDPLKMYYVTGSAVSGFRVFVAKWTGTLNVAQPVPASDLHDVASNLSLGLITPQDVLSSLTAFNPLYDATQRANLSNLVLDGTQNGKLIFHVVSQQDSLGWVFVFDPGNDGEIGKGGTGGIIAANPFWRSPVSRWCSLHTLMPAGDNNPWIQVTSNSPGRYGDGGYMGSKYAVKVANDAGKGNLIQIAPTNGSYEPQSTSTTPAYIQDAQPGDIFWVNAMGPYGTEPVEILSKDSATHTWTVIRGNNLAASRFIQGSTVPPNTAGPVDIKAGMTLYAGCRGSSFSEKIGWGSALWYWNFINDPHGTSITYPAANGTASNQVVENYASGGHAVTRDGVNIMETLSDTMASAWMRWTYPNSTPGYDLVTPSASAPRNIVNAAPTFASIPIRSSGGDDYAKHPSYDQMAAPASEHHWILDAIPFLNAGGIFNAPGALVGGQTNTYKLTGAVLHRKQITALASCGAHPLLDISSPATGNAISDSTPYTYCVANAAGECRSGASTGDVYVNCPGATLLNCARSAQSGQTDICLGDSFVYGNGAVQASMDTHDTNGGSGRLISQMFATDHQEFMFNNVRPTADGKWMLFGSKNPTGAPEMYIAKLPPFPAPDSIRRDTFVPVRINITGRADASTAIVEFGYAENGDPGDFYCTSRQETCVAQGAMVSESQPFFFATTEANAITGMPCSGRRQGPGQNPAPGCIITIPAIPGRVLYYRAVLRDVSGNAIQRQQAAAVAVP